MAQRLPDDPQLSYFEEQAVTLRDLAGAGAAGALELIERHHPKGAHAPSLAGARAVVARHYGFQSWPQLVVYVETVARYRRTPDQVDEPPDLADRFLALACLRYDENDDAARWAEAARILDDHPDLRVTNIFVAAADADVAAVRAQLATRPDAARQEGGPFAWEPILYLAFARHNPSVGEQSVLATARALLDHGADPNAGYLWHGLYPPFTAVTGALGLGEGEQPAHNQGLALAQLLLEAGADANDGQALYNRQFGSDDSHLVLLLKYGLGRGAGGVWRRRMHPWSDPPSEMVRQQLWWAVVHDMRDRVRLLVDAGADIASPVQVGDDRPSWARTTAGRSAAQVAALCGCPELAAWLVERGSPPPPADGVDAFIAAALSGDRREVERLGSHRDQARADRPALIVWAAARRLRGAVVLLAELGFDVNALGRSDIPVEQPWETALHEAAGRGDADLVRTLLDLGANPDMHDARFHATPLGWAEHFDQGHIIQLLGPLTEQ